MSKILIIIPNFNGYKYSQKCLDALERQTFKDFQVCIVDDCSTDDSYKRLIEYSLNSPLNITVIKTPENRGPGFARKIAIEQLNSEWVAFCDIDDWYDDDFLETQYTHAITTDSDLVMCDHWYVYGSGTRIIGGATQWAENTIETKERVLAFSKMSLWRLLVKRELFKGVIFPEIYYGEDAPVTIQLIRNSKKTYVDRDAHYNYLIRQTSASASAAGRSIKDYISAFDLINKKIGDSYPAECCFIGINMILYGIVLLQCKNRVAETEIRETISAFETSFSDWNQNKYLENLDTKKKVFLWLVKHRLIKLCALYSKVHAFLLTR